MIGRRDGGKHRISVGIGSTVVSKFLIKSGIERTATSSGGETAVGAVHGATVWYISSV